VPEYLTGVVKGSSSFPAREFGLLASWLGRPPLSEDFILCARCFMHASPPRSTLATRLRDPRSCFYLHVNSPSSARRFIFLSVESSRNQRSESDWPSFTSASALVFSLCPSCCHFFSSERHKRAPCGGRWSYLLSSPTWSSRFCGNGHSSAQILFHSSRSRRLDAVLHALRLSARLLSRHDFSSLGVLRLRPSYY